MERKDQPIDITPFINKRRLRGQNLPVEGTLALQPDYQVDQFSYPREISRFPLKGELRFTEQKPLNIVGFDSSLEWNTFKRKFFKRLNNGKDKKRAVWDAVKGITENARSHTEEYSKGRDVFSSFYEQVGGKVIDQSGDPVADGIDVKERMGQPKRVWEEEIEPFLLEVEDGIAVTISGKGPTNIKDKKGNFINFEDCYFQLTIKSQGKIRYVTVRTDLSPKQARFVLQDLLTEYNPERQIQKESSDPYIEASNIVGTPVLIKPENQPINQIFFNLVKVIAKINPGAFARGKTVEMIYKEYLDLDQNFKLDVESQTYVDQFLFKLFTNIDSIGSEEMDQQMEQAITEMMVKITLAVHERKPTGLNGSLSFQDIKWAERKMQSYSGCAGSGADSGVIQFGELTLVKTMGGYRIATTEEKWEIGTCKGGCGRSDVPISCHICKQCADKNLISFF